MNKIVFEIWTDNINFLIEKKTTFIKSNKIMMQHFYVTF